MVRVETKGLKELRGRFRKLAKAHPRIMRRGMKRAHVAGRTLMVKEAKRLTGYKVQYIRGQIRSFSGPNSATVIINERKPRNLIEGVVPSQQNYDYGRAKTQGGKYKRDGVKSKSYTENKRRVYHSTFIASPTSKALVFKRTKSGKLRAVFGASVNNIVYQDKLLRQRVIDRMREVFYKTYDHEVGRILNK